MTVRDSFNRAGAILGLLAFAIVAASSYFHGVELLTAVLRGIGSFFAIVVLLRIVLSLLALLPQPVQEEPASLSTTDLASFAERASRN
jgi:hypothetical protein